MPTYEYVCKDCGRRMEAQQSFRDAALTICQHCSGALRKLFSAAGLIFKGSGYYVTDSRNAAKSKSKDKEKDKDKDKASASDGGSSERTDAKSKDGKTGEPAKSGTPAKPAKPAKKAEATSSVSE